MLDMITPELIINLLLILAGAWVCGSIAQRLGFPVMLGELIAGLLLGPPLLGLVAPSPGIELLAELGIFFAMFYAGMEMDPKELLEHFWPSLGVALGGFVVPFVLGYGVTRIFGGTIYQSLFVGMGISITAIAVQAVILQNMRINRTELGHIIIGAAILDDILSLISLSVLVGLAKSGKIDFLNLMFIVLKVLLFFGFTFLAGHYVFPRFTRRLTDEGAKSFTFALITALVLAYLAEKAGLHLIIGAFLAGQFVRKEIMREDVYRAISDRFYGLSYGFLTPIFFATLAFHLHWHLDFHFLAYTLVLTLAAIVGKFVGSGLGLHAFGYRFWECLVVASGMNGRGAVELVVATVVVKLSEDLLAHGRITEPLLTETQFSALVIMAFVTTLLAPVTLKITATRACLAEEKPCFCHLWEEARQRPFR